MPERWQRSRSCCSALAVSAMIGVRHPAPSRARIASVTANPSRSGMWQSISTSAYGTRSSAASAS